MSKQRGRGVLLALSLAALLSLLLAGTLTAQVKQPFEWVWAKRLTVDTSAAIGGNTSVGGTLLVSGGSNLVGNVTTDGTFAADGTITGQAGLTMIPGAAISVTNGGIITPTTAIQELTAAGNVGAELATCGDGQMLTLINLSNVTITITDTGSVKLAGNAALGQYDSLTVVGSGVTCIETARANN